MPETQLEELLAEVKRLADNGQTDQAELLCHNVLQQAPSDARFWAWLGMLGLLMGKLSESEQSFRKAIELAPHNARNWAGLAGTLFKVGRASEAESSFQRALELNGSDAVTWANLAAVLNAQGKWQAAVDAFRQSVRYDDSDAEIWAKLASAEFACENVAAAKAAFERSLSLAPSPNVAVDYAALLVQLNELHGAAHVLDQITRQFPNSTGLAGAHYNLGIALREAGQLDNAESHLRHATRLSPNFADAYGNLAVVLQEQRKPEEAIAAVRQAIRFDPGNAINYNILGNIFLQEHGRVDAAIVSYQRALTLKPDFAKAYSNLGAALLQKGEFNHAFAYYSRAIEIAPDNAGAHADRATLRLLNGDFEHGWPEYEWRWKTGQIAYRELSQPEWRGEALPGRTILIWEEQGFGDTLQFIRYAALLKNQGATVVVECHKALTKVLATSRSVDQIVTREDELPAIDFHSPMLNLPGVFQTDLNNVPANVPYLFADETLISMWRQRLEAVKGFRIGINWRGREGRGTFRKRDIPLDFFLKLAKLPDVKLISLQKGAAQSGLLPELPIFDPGDDFDHSRGAFMDTAAILKNLDLVITSDTSVPHLAGALGAPVWVALPYVSDWRWLLNRSDSPWYPTMRLFRQKKADDWTSVFKEIEAALQHRLNDSPR